MSNELKNEKKELIKNFKVVIEDLLDHYEQYTDEEKAAIKDVFEKVAALNTVLDKYDVENKLTWSGYINAVGRYFDNMR